jgi:hypothetical protein
MKSSLFFILILLLFGSTHSVGQGYAAVGDTLSWMIIGTTTTQHDFRPNIDWYEDIYAIDGIQAKSGKRSVGLAFVSSALVPGLGQGVVNNQWVKTGVFVALEGAALYGHFKNLDLGRDLERRYWDYVETGWSAAKYVQFLVDYHNFYFPNNPKSYNDIATSGSNLAALIASGNFPANVRQEWPLIDLQKLRQLESQILYGGTSGNAFSHSLPNYGSQQYYELVSKYFQFGPGWKDFNVPVNQINWEIEGMSDAWLTGAARSKRFNDRLRTARNMASIVFVNHIISGFDALFSARLHNHRIETAFSPVDGGTIYLSVRF